MKTNFLRGADPKKLLDIGIARFDKKWEDENYREYPENTELSPEQAILFLRNPKLAPYIVKDLVRQPDWTIEYQVLLFNYFLTHGGELNISELYPRREIPKFNIRRIIDQLQANKIIHIDREKTPWKAYLLMGNIKGIDESANFERGLDPKELMNIGVKQIIYNILKKFFEEEIMKNFIFNSFYPDNKGNYKFSAQVSKKQMEKIIKKYDLDRYLEFPGKYAEISGTAWKTCNVVQFKIKDPFVNIFNKISSYETFIRQMDESQIFEKESDSMRAQFVRGRDPKDSMNIGNKHARETQKLIAAFKEIDPKLEPKMEDFYNKDDVPAHIITAPDGESVSAYVLVNGNNHSLAWVKNRSTEFYVAAGVKNKKSYMKTFPTLERAKELTERYIYDDI